MTSPEVDLTAYDKDASIARQSYKQHEKNNIEKARSIGIPVTIKNGLAYIAIQDAIDFFEQNLKQKDAIK